PKTNDWNTNATLPKRSDWDDRLKIVGSAGKSKLLVKMRDLNQEAQVTATKGKPNVFNDYNRIKVKEDDAKADYRAIHRYEAWNMAEGYRRKFDRLLGDYVTKKSGSKTTQALTEANIQANLKRLTNLTILQAKSIGFWSVWVTIFKK